MGLSDPLDDLINTARQRKEKSVPASPPPAGTSEEQKALNPIDLLTLPADQREVINYLARQKQAPLEGIQAGVPTLTPTEVVQALQTLKESGYIREALLDGEINYRVAFGGTASRTKIYLPEQIWSSLNLDNLTFLEGIPLFQQLPQDELKTLANELETRHYRRDEVIVWQDEPSDDAYLIKNGIVGISRLAPGIRQSQNLAYLKEGDILGEIGVLRDQARSATATALSKVDVLVIDRQRFLELLQKYDAASLALARMLGRQLVATSARLEPPHPTGTTVDQAGRDHEVAVYISTTIEADRSIDTNPYVDKTLAFLGQIFGEATGSQAQGVWDSDEAGQVSETVSIVRSFVTQEEIEFHLSDVLDYVADLKIELKQEAMAVEVDQKIMLI